jgi:type IV secretory pathway component VirB8
MKTNESITLYFAYEELGRQVVLYKRVIIALVVVLALAVISSVMLASNWQPQVRFVLLRDQGKHVTASILPEKIEIEQKTALFAQLLGQYVKDRHTIDNVTDEYRFKTILRSMSGDSSYSQMLEEFKKIQTMLSGSTRSIEIKSIVTIGTDMVRVEFKTIDASGKDQTTRSWEANIAYRVLEGKEMSSEIIQYNPAGIVVEKYSIINKD